MMRRPPPRPGLGKKAASGFKITYSVTQLLDRGKDSVSKEAGCPPLEGWEKYQYDKIGPLHQEDGNSRPAQAATKEYLSTLVMRPGSARDLHAEHLAALAAKQAQEPEHSSLGPRGGSTRGAGMGWGDRDRDRDRDRYGDRNKDRGLSRFDHDRDRRGDGGRRDRVRDAQQPSGRAPSRWDALKPDRDRDRGYNNRSNRDSRDRDDGDELVGGGRQDARLVGGRDRDRDGRNARAVDGMRDGGLAAHDRALANEKATAAGGGGGRERDRDRLGGSGSGGGRDRYGGSGGGVNNDADIWDMPSSALPGGEGASKDPPRNSRAAGLKSAEREQREKDQKAEEVREFQAKKLMFEKELEKERAAYKQQGPPKGAAAVPNGDATDFPDMGGGFLEGNDEDGGGDGNSGLLGGALEENTSATPIRDNGNEDGSATRFEGGKPERDGKQKTRGSFLDGFLGGGGREDGTRVGGVISTAESEPRDGGSVAGAGGGAEGGGGGGFPGGGFFSFMAPGNSISTIDKITEVTRGGAGKIFSPDSTVPGVVPSRLSPWENTENKTAKAAAATATAAAPRSGGASGGEGSTAALSAAEKSALLKRMIMGGGAGATRRSDASPSQQTDSLRPAADGLVGRERRSLWGNGSAPLEAARSPVVGTEGGVREKVDGGSPVGGQPREGGASTAEVDMLMQKLAVARLPENQRREAFKQAQKQHELQQHYQQRQHQHQHQPIGDGRSSPFLMPLQPPRNPFGSPPPSGQPEPPVGLPHSLPSMRSSSPPLGGIAFPAGGQMPLAGGNGAESLMGPPGRLPTNNGQQPQLGMDFAVEEARRRQLRQQQVQAIQLQRERRERDQYRELQIQQQKLDREREHQRLEQQRQQDLRHRQEQLQHEQQQAALRQRQQQQQRRYAGEGTGVPLTPGSHVLQQQQQQQLLRQRQLHMHQQQMHIRQHPHAHQQHVPRASAISSVRAMQGGPVARSLLQQHQQQQQQQQRQLVGEVGVDGGSHHLSPVGGPIVMPGQQHAGYPQAGHPVARQPQQHGGGGYPGVTGGGHLQQRQQLPSSISPVTMAHAGGGGGTNIMNTSAEFPSSTRAEDLLSVLGLQKTPTDTGAGQAGYGGGGDLSASGSGGGHQFAFHEPHPGARRARAVNGMGGSMALDPRARARALAGGMGVGPGVGVGGRKMVVRPGGAPGQMTADEMDRMVTGN